eukprot:CAMPEP_0184372762 /NCGR_PEP_ID=MMETSP1089-20130417/164118_1 /TAXON_ID=38269 ORGANISM="Gloeochaete wittrockiana, Strain SAG46.84" /NCGR_SAMPLE_ID=MMETSP1089 /ASSEMBLY_ACC=CAM_ASM_000445 /LENGTH=44 /DNA_ID= /DNA_START= /DNA_END= /DNA_ORIENTATION=
MSATLAMPVLATEIYVFREPLLTASIFRAFAHDMLAMHSELCPD